jgi:hypothetical protein
MLNKKFKLLPLACLTLSCINFGATATEATSLLDGSALTSSNFFKDSKIDFSTVNKFQYLNSNDYPSFTSTVQTAWAQGVKGDYTSGYIADMFGLDASYTGVAKLAASDYFFTREYLQATSDTNGDHLSEPSGFSKFNQIYAKQKFGDETHYFRLYEGQRQLPHFGSISMQEKVANSSWYGVSTEAGYDELAMRLAYVTKYSDSDEPNQEDLLTSDGNVIDNIITGDVAWKNQDKNILFLMGESKNYLRRYGLEMSMNMPNQSGLWILGSQIYMNQGLTMWKDMSSSNKFYDDNAYHFAIDATHIAGPWFTKMGYGYSVAKRAGNVGKFGWDMSANTKGNFNALAAGLSSDFTNDQEHFLGLINMYQFNPDYAAGLVGRFGYGHKYQGNHFQDIEIGLLNKWTPTQVKGLTAFFGFGPNWTFKRQFDNTPQLDDNGNWERGRGFCITSSLEYKF